MRVVDAGGQEEQKCGSNADEPGLQPVPLHLHHHSRKAAAGRWQSEPSHVDSLLTLAVYTLVSALWYKVIAVRTHDNDGWPVAERLSHCIATITCAQAYKAVSNQSAKPLLLHCMRHRERQGSPAAITQRCDEHGCNRASVMCRAVGM